MGTEAGGVVVVDIDRINTCLGRNVAVTFEEFVEKKKNKYKKGHHHHHHGHIDGFICCFSKPRPTYQASGVLVVSKSTRQWRKMEANFRSDYDVIAIGDVFYANVEGGKDYIALHFQRAWILEVLVLVLF
ncbi:PREDICTED: uncharacterized protein LOC104810589 [Tarenaya hassleriana]|uniref:uncharacterized protein LOC104810589 n=1 Tax=Tarenaya hassleriana TaxID=28532 RepID=UPI00053C8C70|nr:PREDICTED: uncharacterized protein LOC104810589 [Tarenaya hassleriana]